MGQYLYEITPNPHNLVEPTMAFIIVTLLAVFAVTGHASEYSPGYARMVSYEDTAW